jgi:FAD/FMN-containing dehydrogenase
VTDMSRRDILALAAVASASAVGLPASPAGAAVSSAARSAALASQAEAATASLTGRVVRADDPDYEAARTDWDGLFSHYPLAIVFCRDSDDVVNALSWARQHRLAVRARSGRHNLEGWSNVDGGLVIDVSEIKGVSLTSSRRTATVGAGLTQGEFGRRTNSDLLWACRGGGGGNFGIVTSLTYRVHPVSNVAVLVARWPNLASLQGVFTAWQETAPRADLA